VPISPSFSYVYFQNDACDVLCLFDALDLFLSSCFNFPSMQQTRRRLSPKQLNSLHTVFDRRSAVNSTDQRDIYHLGGDSYANITNNLSKVKASVLMYNSQNLIGHVKTIHQSRKIQTTTKCVKTQAELKAAVAKAGSLSRTKIKLCASRIRLGTTARRLDDGVQDRTRGIDLSNKNIIFICRNRNHRCKLDGVGRTRIFYGTNATVAFHNIKFNNGYNDGAGGALKMMNGSVVELTNCSFFNNTATSRSAISVNNSDLVINGVRSSVSQNKGNGAPVEVLSSTAALNDVVFRGNDVSQFVSRFTCFRCSR
jgi:hypothetical protein